MKWLFLLLLLANVAFAVYARMAQQNTEPQVLQAQLNAAAVKLLTPEQAAEYPGRKPPPPAAAENACLEWGGFGGGELVRAQAELAKLQLGEKLAARETAETVGHWAYIPPLKSRAERDKKMAELKALGVEEFFPVQESGQWQNAISLGVFRSEEAAADFAARLRTKGVRSAQSGARPGVLKQTVFQIREPDEALVAKLVELKQAFPGSGLGAAPCKAGG